MKPILFELPLPLLGKVSFPSYTTMIMLGFVVAVWVLRRDGERAGMDGQRLVDLSLIMLAVGIFGARMLSVLTDGKLMDFVHLCNAPWKVPAIDARVAHCTTDAQCGYDYLCDSARHLCHPPRDCLAALKFWQGGLTFYGGLVLAAPTGIWYARRKKLGMWRVADVTAPVLMLALAFGRIGCFLNGCCYGKPTSSWIGVKFPGHPLPLYPTQLYSSLNALVLFFVLRKLIAPRKRGDGEVFGWLLVLYGVMRSVIEIYRGDPRGSLGPLSTSQVISIPLVAFGVWLIASRRRGSRPAPSADSGE